MCPSINGQSQVLFLSSGLTTTLAMQAPLSKHIRGGWRDYFLTKFPPSRPPPPKKKEPPPASLNFSYSMDRLTFMAEAPEVELPYPDDFLHLQRPRALHEINAEFEELLIGRNKSVSHFVRLCLAGRYRENLAESSANDYRYKINVRSGLSGIAYPEENWIITGDWDSAIGMTEDLPFTVPMAFFAVPPFRDTLKKSNHIRGIASVEVFAQKYVSNTQANPLKPVGKRENGYAPYHPKLRFRFGPASAHDSGFPSRVMGF